MLSAVISFVVPANGPPEVFVDASTVGTPLDGLQADVPLVINATADLTSEGPTIGTSIVGVRASAPDVLRFATKGLRGKTVSVLVTDLSR